MTFAVTHTHVSAIADDGSDVGSNAWNASHTLSMATNTVLGRLTAGTGTPEELTGTQVTTMLDAFTSTLKGLAPSSGGGTTNFLRADGTWAAPTASIAPLTLVDANTVDQRNSTNAQTFRVYNTFTDVNNYERAVFDWTTTANKLTIGTQAAGTGTAREITIQTNKIYDFFTSVNGNNPIRIGSVYNGNSISGLSLAAAAGIYWVASGQSTAGTEDTGIHRVAAGVAAFDGGFASGGAIGWMQWAGQTRVTSDVAFTSTTTLGTVTGLSVNVAAGRTYAFEAYLSFTDAAAGGIKAAIAGTATATAIEYDGWIIDSAANGIKGNTQAAALGTAVASATTTGTAGVVQIKGTITVNAAGTLLVQAAQNTSSGTATTIKRGSYFIVYDMP